MFSLRSLTTAFALSVPNVQFWDIRGYLEKTVIQIPLSVCNELPQRCDEKQNIESSDRGKRVEANRSTGGGRGQAVTLYIHRMSDGIDDRNGLPYSSGLE